MRRLEERVDELEEIVTTLAEAIAQLQAEDQELAADAAAVQTALQANAAAIAALQAQLAAGNLSPDQEAALTQIVNDLNAAHGTIQAALNPPAPPPAP